MNKHLNLAKKIARKSNYRYKMSAIIFDGNRVISSGYNKVIPCEIDTIGSKYSNKLLFDCSIHAEMMALMRARKWDVIGKEMLVIRIRKNGSIGNSKPCNNCLSNIIGAGIKVIYFWQDNIINQMKVEI